MQKTTIVYWQEDDGLWVGYLHEHPDYMTQGENLEELKKISEIFIWILLPT